MEYRIRYRDSNKSGGSTVVVEANSPTEALVKFRHVYVKGAVPSGAAEQVVSVCVESDCNTMHW